MTGGASRQRHPLPEPGHRAPRRRPNENARAPTIASAAAYVHRLKTLPTRANARLHSDGLSSYRRTPTRQPSCHLSPEKAILRPLSLGGSILRRMARVSVARPRSEVIIGPASIQKRYDCPRTAAAALRKLDLLAARGLLVPSVLERAGSCYTLARIPGDTLQAHLLAHPTSSTTLDALVDAFRLLARVHGALADEAGIDSQYAEGFTCAWRRLYPSHSYPARTQVIHADYSPGNLILGDSDRLVILDPEPNGYVTTDALGRYNPLIDLACLVGALTVRGTVRRIARGAVRAPVHGALRAGLHEYERLSRLHVDRASLRRIIRADLVSYLWSRHRLIPARAVSAVIAKPALRWLSVV